MENQWKIFEKRPILNKKMIKKISQINKPNFISQKIFDKNFVAVHCVKTVLTLNKSIYLGFTILELSKLLMYKFHYDYVSNKCGC